MLQIGIRNEIVVVVELMKSSRNESNWFGCGFYNERKRQPKKQILNCTNERKINSRNIYLYFLSRWKTKICILFLLLFINFDLFVSHFCWFFVFFYFCGSIKENIVNFHVQTRYLSFSFNKSRSAVFWMNWKEAKKADKTKRKRKVNSNGEKTKTKGFLSFILFSFFRLLCVSVSFRFCFIFVQTLSFVFGCWNRLGSQLNISMWKRRKSWSSSRFERRHFMPKNIISRQSNVANIFL